MRPRTLFSFVLVMIALVSCKDDAETRAAADAKYHYAVAMTGVV